LSVIHLSLIFNIHKYARWRSDFSCVGFVKHKDENWKENSEERIMTRGNTRVEWKDYSFQNCGVVSCFLFSNHVSSTTTHPNFNLVDNSNSHNKIPFFMHFLNTKFTSKIFLIMLLPSFQNINYFNTTHVNLKKKLKK